MPILALRNAGGIRRGLWSLIPLALLCGSGLVSITDAGSPQDADSKSSGAPQITVFVIEAERGLKTTDAKLDDLKTRLEKLLPGHGFTLLDARSRPIVAGETSVVSNLTNGYKLTTTLTGALDEQGKYEIRCQLASEHGKPRSTRVHAPLNQLFFLLYKLESGKVLLVGIGAR